MPSQRLILLRHAKSAWDDPEQRDHDRPLNARGRAACDAIGDWLAMRGYLPAQVLCSTAARTVETWERVSARLPDSPEATYLPGLYHAEPHAIRAAIAQAVATPLLVIGHNPGFGELAHRVVVTPPAHPKFGQYPTAATLVADLSGEGWAEAINAPGTVVDFTVPRDLIG